MRASAKTAMERSLRGPDLAGPKLRTEGTGLLPESTRITLSRRNRQSSKHRANSRLSGTPCVEWKWRTHPRRPGFSTRATPTSSAPRLAGSALRECAGAPREAPGRPCDGPRGATIPAPRAGRGFRGPILARLKGPNPAAVSRLALGALSRLAHGTDVAGTASVGLARRTPRERNGRSPAETPIFRSITHGPPQPQTDPRAGSRLAFERRARTEAPRGTSLESASLMQRSCRCKSSVSSDR